MFRMIAGFILVFAAALAATWLADQPGAIVIRLGAYEITVSLLITGAVLAIGAVILMLLWRSYYWITGAPEAIGDWFRSRGRRKGFDALSHGLVAAGAGDGDAAAREVATAERHLGGAPLTLLLKAQTAQLRGEPDAARSAYEDMLKLPDTEALGLRGLFLEAQRTGDTAAARRLVERAVALKPSMDWASTALFALQAAAHDWAGARETLDLRRKHRQVERKAEARARAVLFAAEAQEADDGGRSEAALEAAIAANRLATDLVPAAAIAGRILAEKGETGRATKLVEKTWKLNPHPDLANVYIHARPGDAIRDRLRRARILVGKTPKSPEGRIAAARAAIEGRDWDEAREFLKPLLEDAPTRRVCMLMAELENGEHGNRGRVREWLARAVSAPRDPAWTASGHVSERWLPVSPITGAFDVYEWRVPVEGAPAPVAAAIETLANPDADREDVPQLSVLTDAAEADDSSTDADETPTEVAEEKKPDETPVVSKSPNGAAPSESETAAVTDKKPTPATEPAGKDAEKGLDAAAPAGANTKPAAATKDADAPEKDATPRPIVAPIPDDPGVDGDEFDDDAPRPKGFTAA